MGGHSGQRISRNCRCQKTQGNPTRAREKRWPRQVQSLCLLSGFPSPKHCRQGHRHNFNDMSTEQLAEGTWRAGGAYCNKCCCLPRASVRSSMCSRFEAGKRSRTLKAGHAISDCFPQKACHKPYAVACVCPSIHHVCHALILWGAFFEALKPQRTFRDGSTTRGSGPSTAMTVASRDPTFVFVSAGLRPNASCRGACPRLRCNRPMSASLLSTPRSLSPPDVAPSRHDARPTCGLALTCASQMPRPTPPCRNDCAIPTWFSFV